MEPTTPADRDQSRARESLDEWLSLSEARAILDVMSDDIVRIWAQEFGWLRSRVLPDGALQVLREDVLREKATRDDLSAIGGEEMTEEQLRAVREGRLGTLPWEREQRNAPAA